VLDELGYTGAPKVGAVPLFDVISTAYERTNLIMTTNLPLGSWTEVLGSDRLAGATFDRLTRRCRIFGTEGERYTLHDANARTRRATVQQPDRPVEDATGSRQPRGHRCWRFRPARCWVRSAFTEPDSLFCHQQGRAAGQRRHSFQRRQCSSVDHAQ
jgi:hypothetical protein